MSDPNTPENFATDSLDQELQSPAPPVMKTLSLWRGGHYFRIVYAAGHEQLVLGQITDWAKSHDLPFGWGDAMLLATLIGQDLARPIEMLLPPKTEEPNEQ